VVELDDLRLLHVLGGLGGEAHHQHSADREVGSDEDVPGTAIRGLLGDRLGLRGERVDVKACRSDHHVRARAQARERVLKRCVGTGEIDYHLWRIALEHLGERDLELWVGAPC
jgi:hypothetical protein